MKRIFIIFLIVLLFLTGCGQDDVVILSLPEYTSKAIYTEGVWQDYTDYGIYTFSSFDEDKLEKNVYFEKVQDAGSVLPYLENFEGWITEGSELFNNYNFDKTCINKDDYIFIDTEEGKSIGNSNRTYGKFDNYNVYFFDVDTYTLYYFHNNT